MSRKYELKRRAERQAETRRRIVDATVDAPYERRPRSDDDLGDRRARRGRAPHRLRALPDERTLFQACSTHWRELHPLPDSGRWERIADPARRLRAALNDVYAWYEVVEGDLAIFSRDAGVHALTAELVDRRERAVGSLRGALADGWSRRKAVQAAIGHALDFETWRSLTRRQGLTRAQAVDAMLRFVASV